MPLSQCVIRRADNGNQSPPWFKHLPRAPLYFPAQRVVNNINIAQKRKIFLRMINNLICTPTFYAFNIACRYRRGYVSSPQFC